MRKIIVLLFLISPLWAASQDYNWSLGVQMMPSIGFDAISNLRDDVGLFNLNTGIRVSKKTINEKHYLESGIYWYRFLVRDSIITDYVEDIPLKESLDQKTYYLHIPLKWHYQRKNFYCAAGMEIKKLVMGRFIIDETSYPWDKVSSPLQLGLIGNIGYLHHLNDRFFLSIDGFYNYSITQKRIYGYGSRIGINYKFGI